MTEETGQAGRDFFKLNGVPDVAGPFPEAGRQIYVAYESQWNAFAMLVDRLDWTLCLIPSDPSAPDHDGIPTYCLQPKESTP